MNSNLFYEIAVIILINKLLYYGKKPYNEIIMIPAFRRYKPVLKITDQNVYTAWCQMRNNSISRIFKQERNKRTDMEFWDIYDKDKKPTGRTMKRNDWCLKDGEYHLTVLGVIARPDGKFLITKRVMTKAWAPGWWEVSGGAAQAGEESYEAVLREVKEETGLDARNAEGGYLFTYKRENPGEGDNYFVDVYRFVMDIDEKDLHLQTEETDGYMFASVDEIKAFAADGKFLHYDSIKKAFEL